MRLGSFFVFVALCSLTAYYIYEPIPEKIEERWKLMLTNSFFRSLSHLVSKKKRGRIFILVWAASLCECLLFKNKKKYFHFNEPGSQSEYRINPQGKPPQTYLLFL